MSFVIRRNGICLSLACCAAIIPAIARANDTSPAVLDIGSRPQVFIDKRFLNQAKNVQLVVHQPVKTGEYTIKPDRPWEHGIGVYNCVLEENGAYRMWYESGGGICYAVSNDGIQWEKPALGLADVKGDKQNNIVIGHGAAGIDKMGEGGMVFIDPTAPPDQRYRMTLREHEPEVLKADAPPDVNVLSSPDGIHWRMTHQHVLTFREPDLRQHLDTQNVLFWDDRIHKYVAYMRRNVRKGGPRFRTVVRSESPTIGNFEQAQKAAIVLGPDEYDARFGVPDDVDYYTSAAIKYPGAQDAYYMFPQVYFHYIAGKLSEFPRQAPSNAGPLDTQFSASRDGIHWERYDRRPFIRLGMPGTFDSKNARACYGIVLSRDGREMYLYYVGTDHLHGWPGRERKGEETHYADPEIEKKERARADRNRKLLTDAGLQPVLDVSAISRVVIRRDGFVSAQAYYKGGEFTTGPLKFSGQELVLNLDTSATGWLQCELLDESGKPVAGHSLEDCNVIHTCNEIDRVVRWKGGKDVSPLAGRPLRLRFVYQSADLYAFRFR